LEIGALLLKQPSILTERSLRQRSVTARVASDRERSFEPLDLAAIGLGPFPLVGKVRPPVNHRTEPRASRHGALVTAPSVQLGGVARHQLPEPAGLRAQTLGAILRAIEALARLSSLETL